MSVRERHELVELYRGSDAAGGVLCTLVRATAVECRQGARLLVLSEAKVAGHTEGALAEQLRDITGKPGKTAAILPLEAIVHRYAEVGLDVLIEPAASAETQALMTALHDSAHGHSALVVTVLPEDRRRFGRVVVREDGNVTFASDHISTDDVVDLRAFARQQLGHVTTDATHSFRHVFLERVAPYDSTNLREAL